MESSSSLRMWIGTLLAAAGFSAAFFSLVVILKHREWLALDFFFSGFGGPIVLCGVAAVGAYFLSRGAPGLIGKWSIAIAAFIVTLLVQVAVVLVTYCLLGECF